MLQEPFWALLNLLECKTACKISEQISPNSCSSDSNSNASTPGVIKQTVQHSTGYLTARAPWFITFRCFCTRGSHRSRRGGEKAKAVAKASPPSSPDWSAEKGWGNISDDKRLP